MLRNSRNSQQFPTFLWENQSQDPKRCKKGPRGPFYTSWTRNVLAPKGSQETSGIPGITRNYQEFQENSQNP